MDGDMADNNVVKVKCPDCGGGFKNHVVLCEHTKTWADNENQEHGATTYQVCQCQGCDEVRFRVDDWSTYYIDPYTGEAESTITVYPEFVGNQREPAVTESLADVAPQVDRIYRETVKALNAGTLILAGAGLRAVVEAICQHENAKGGDLKQKIDALVKQGKLAHAQAGLLHEERYLGNDAIHEVEPPSQSEIEDGLVIVEALLTTLYVAAQRGVRLKQQRARRETARAAKSINAKKPETPALMPPTAQPDAASRPGPGDGPVAKEGDDEPEI
jgi:hypothetical protein